MSVRSDVRAFVRAAAWAGIAGAAVFTVGWIIGGFVQPASYSWSMQEISDLGALTADHAWAWNLADSLSGALIAFFALGLFQWLRSSRPGRIGAALVGVVGVGGTVDGLAREDCPLSTSRACQALRDGPGLSWHHQVHDIESVIVFAAMIAAPFVLAGAFRRIEARDGLRVYTRATGFAMVAVTGAYVLSYGDRGGGIAERALSVIFMAWIATLAGLMLRSSRAWASSDAPAR